MPPPTGGGGGVWAASIAATTGGLCDNAFAAQPTPTQRPAANIRDLDLITAVSKALCPQNINSMRYMFSLPAGHLPATLHLPPSIAAFTAACCRGIRGLVKLDALQASPESFFSCFACPERRLRHCDVHGRFRHCLGSRGGGLAQSCRRFPCADASQLGVGAEAGLRPAATASR